MRTKLFIFLYLPLLLCGCNRPAGYDPNVFYNKILFNTYESMIDDARKEDIYASQYLNENYQNLRTNKFVPTFDAKLDDSNKTQYFKCGQDVTDSWIEKSDKAQLEGVRIMNRRWFYIANEFNDYQVIFSFYNWFFKDDSFDTNSFEWIKVNTLDEVENVDKYQNVGFYEYVFNLIKDQPLLYGGSSSYKINDSNGNRIINMHILTKLDADRIFETYKNHIMQRCKEMFL